MKKLVGFPNFVAKVAHGPGKKPLNFGGNPHNITLELWLVSVWLELRHLFNSNNFARL